MMFKKGHIKILSLVFLLNFLASCYKINDNDLKESISGAMSSWKGTKWWKSFEDPLLNQFAEQVLTENLDIKIAAARFIAAHESTKIVSSKLYPELFAKGSFERQKGLSYPEQENLGLAGLNLNWDIDVFGKNRAALRKAQAHENRLSANINQVRNLMIAKLAEATIDWRQAQETIKTTRLILNAEDLEIKLFDERQKAGLIDASFTERAKAERAQTATQIPQANAARATAMNQISLLLGFTDDRLTQSLKSAPMKRIKITSPEWIHEISLKTIKKRPDVQGARFQLLAAQANLEEAEANLWPNLSVGGFFGLGDGTKGTNLGSNPFWTMASSVTAPILNFGRLKAAVGSASAKAQEAEFNYQNTVLLALQETKTALSDYLYHLNTLHAQDEALKRRKAVVDLAKERFEKGLTNMTNLTTAQTELTQATLESIKLQTMTAKAYIRFEMALGLGD